MMRFLIISCFLLFAGESFAQQLTLDSAIAIAMRNSPGLMISKNNVDIAGINNNYGMAGGLPLVQANSSVTEQLTTPRTEIFQSGQ